jgi:secretion/DNA translocation related CpaE-like protein
MTASTLARRPLLIGPTSEVMDQVLGLAAAGGIEVDVATDRAAAGASWRNAPVVVVVDRGDPPPQRDRRSDLLLVSSDLDDGDVWRRAHLWGAEHVVMLPDGREWLMERLADAGSAVARGSTVTVVGGCGGAGASTLACALAIHASTSGVPTALVDADASGAGIDLVLGAEDAFGVRWDDLALIEGRVDGRTLLTAMPNLRGLPFLSCSRDQRSAVDPDALLAVVGESIDLGKLRHDAHPPTDCGSRG